MRSEKVMALTQIICPQSKSEITETILRSLPDWFGIEEAIQDYVKDVKDTVFFIYSHQDKSIGFISLKKHFQSSYEVYVMGVKEDYLNKGIGTKLLKAAELYLLKNNVQFLQVKTLSEARPDKYYDKTRNFYLKNSFIPLEEFPRLWDESNPCLQLIKTLN